MATSQFSLGFSSLGQPELTLVQLENLAREFGLDFLELRSVASRMDLPAYFSESRETSSLPIRVLGTSLRLSEATDEALAEFYQFADLANYFGVPYLRVFGGGHDHELLKEAVIAEAAKTASAIREELTARLYTCDILLETHSGFSPPDTCVAFNAQLSKPVPILWDAHHTWKIAGEPLEVSWNKLAPWIRHVHYKDSLPAEDGKYNYVLPGQGTFPTATFLDLLTRNHYAGGLSLEWEKLWHKELPDLRPALEKFRSLF